MCSKEATTYTFESAVYAENPPLFHCLLQLHNRPPVPLPITAAMCVYQTTCYVCPSCHYVAETHGVWFACESARTWEPRGGFYSCPGARDAREQRVDFPTSCQKCLNLQHLQYLTDNGIEVDS